MAHFKITTKALNKNDDVLFKSMLQIVNAQLTAEWSFHDDAEIILVDMEEREGQQFWQQQQAQRVLIAYAREKPAEATWFLPRPIRVKPLIQTLNALAAAQQFLPTAAASSTTTPATTPSISSIPSTPAIKTASPVVSTASLSQDAFDPEQSLIGLLKQAVAKQQAMCFQIAAATPLFFSAKRQQCLTAQLQLNTLAATPTHLYNVSQEQIQCEPIAETAVIKAIAEQGGQFYPLAAIIWLTALSASKGRLIVGHLLQQPVKLKHWPNLAVLPHQPHHIRLAAFMTRNSATLATVAEKTQVSIAQVVDFFNACQLEQLVEHTEQAALLNKNNVSDAKRSLFRGILKRLLQ